MDDEIIIMYHNKRNAYLPFGIGRVGDNCGNRTMSFRLRNIVPEAKRDATITIQIVYDGDNGGLFGF